MEGMNTAKTSANAGAKVQTSSTSNQKSKELQLLKYSLTRIEKSFQCFKSSLNLPYNPEVNTIGLNGIIQKYHNLQYNNLDEYMKDIKELARSYSIQFAQDPRYRGMLRDFKEVTERDVKSIRKCNDCFENWGLNPTGYFTNVCTKPHLIVYAKLDGFPFWPAKVLEVYANMVNVEFFGDHTQADVSVQNCILYSKAHVNNSRKRDDSFNHAKEELDMHIRKIGEKFGKIVPKDKKEVISPQNYEKQRMAMFPGAFRAPSTVTDGENSGHSKASTSKEPAPAAKSPSVAAGGTPTKVHPQNTTVTPPKIEKPRMTIRSQSVVIKLDEGEVKKLLTRSDAPMAKGDGQKEGTRRSNKTPESLANKGPVQAKKSSDQSATVTPTKKAGSEADRKRRSNESPELMANNNKGDSVQLINPSVQKMGVTPTKKDTSEAGQKRKATMADGSAGDTVPSKKVRSEEFTVPIADLGTYVKDKFDELHKQNNNLKAENRRLNGDLKTLAETNEQLKKTISMLKKSQGPKCAFCLGDAKSHTDENSGDD